MRKLWLFPLLISAALGQNTLSPSAPVGTIRAGVPFTFQIVASGSGFAGTQFTLALPPDAVNVNVLAGSALTLASKQLQCNTSAIQQTCLAYGINSNLVQPGTIASVTLTLTSTGQHNLGIASPVEGTAAGGAIAVTANPPIAVSVLGSSNCDLNGDGVVNAADAQQIATWVLGLAPVPSGQHCDVNGDTQCNVLDVLVIAQAASGGVCSAI